MFHPLLLLVICLIGSSLADDSEVLWKAFDKCSSKFPSIDVKILGDMFKGSSHNQTIGKDIKCLVKCVGEESGFGSAEGKIIAIKFKTSLSAEPDQAKVDAAIAKCASLVKSDACDTAFDQFKCVCEMAYAW